MIRRRLRVLVITGDHSRSDPTKWSGGYTEDDLSLHEEMVAALRTLPRYHIDVLSRHGGLLERLLVDPPDLVLNFCDTGLDNVPAKEPHLPALLELLDIPFTGAGPVGLVLCYDKHVVERVADSLAVPVPQSLYLEPGVMPAETDAFYPALIKPACGDGSVGIFPQSLVHSREEAARHFAWLRRNLPDAPVLWQEYLPGPEYGLTLIGNPDTGLTALPTLEVDYSGLDQGLPPILPFESKTGPETRYSGVRIRQARLDPDTLRELQSRSGRLFVRLGCRDYARFDFRASADGEIRLLEVNPNPAWSPAAKMAIMAGYAGRSYADLLEMILDAASARIEAR